MERDEPEDKKPLSLAELVLLHWDDFTPIEEYSGNPDLLNDDDDDDE